MTAPQAFDVTIIPIETYQHFERLTGLVDDANAIAGLFADLGGAVVPPWAVVDLDEATARRRMQTWARREVPSSVLVWLGHGASDGTTSCLACYDTPQPIVDNGLVPATLENHLRTDWQHRETVGDAWIVVIIEACGSASFVNHLSGLLAKYDMDRMCLIAVTGSGAAYLGQLRQTLTAIVQRLTVNDEVITTRSLVDQLEDGLPPGRRVQRGTLGAAPLPRRVSGANVCSTYDLRAELESVLARVSPDERNHFFPKARSTEFTEAGFHFVGRERESALIYQWLAAATNGLLVITGGPGSGKSALLGNLVLQTSRHWRALIESSGWWRDPAAPADAFDAAVHLTGLDTHEVVSRIAEVAGLARPGAGWSEQDTDALVAGLAGRRFTLLVDGLDEAVDPVAVASTVLRRLADLPAVRVVVGTRPSAAEESASADLLVALKVGSAGAIRLYPDREALAAYVRSRLASAPLTAESVERIVAALTTRPDDPEFLYARLAVHEILAQPALVGGAGLAALHRGDQRTLFGIAVSRLAATTPHALALLRVLALAGGRGIQRSERVWARAASSLGGGSVVTEADIDLFLERAGPYIMIDAEYGLTVYRLSHQSYRDVLVPESGHG